MRLLTDFAYKYAFLLPALLRGTTRALLPLLAYHADWECSAGGSDEFTGCRVGGLGPA
jgi:hypothetical protein